MIVKFTFIAMLSLLSTGSAFANCTEIVYGNSEWSFEHTKFENVRKIKEADRLGCDFNQKHNCFNSRKVLVSALSCAVLSGKEEAVKELINSQVDVNSVDSSKETPLSYAVKMSDIQIVNHLIKAGAKDPKIMDQAIKSKDAEGPLLAIRVHLLKENEKFDVCDQYTYGQVSKMFFTAKALSKNDDRDLKLKEFAEKKLYPLSSQEGFDKAQAECSIAKKGAKVKSTVGAP